MSPYGFSAPRSGPLLASKNFSLSSQDLGSLSIYHITSATTPPALADFLYAQFHDELDRGASYPQELPFSRTAFDDYFLAHDLFVGIISDQHHPSLELAKGNREWDSCVGGVYYVCLFIVIDVHACLVHSTSLLSFNR